MATVLTVTANPLVDFLGSGEPRPGAVTRVPLFEVAAGGKGINSGRVLASFGHRVLAAFFAGGPTGAILRERAAADGLDAIVVPTAARSRVGFQLARCGGGSTGVLEDGFEVVEGEVAAMASAVRGRLSGVELVLLGGSVPHPSCRDLYRTICEDSARAGVPCWMDAYGEAASRALDSSAPPVLAKPNRQELTAAFDRCPEVHVTDGPRPIEARLGGSRICVTPPAVSEVNPVGSGDCYLAALAHARLSGWPLDRQLRFAAAAGAANARAGRVARIRLDEVEALAEGVAIEYLGGETPRGT